MAAHKWYDNVAPTMDGEIDFEISRLHSVAFAGWDREARALRSFGLEDGMHVLEVGSGPGFMTELLGELVPNGRITAVEPFEPLRKYAEAYLADRISTPHRILDGTATKLPVESGSCDFAIARLVFQHLEDPVAGATEIMRVLRPGGRALILDIDWDLATLSDPMIPRYRTIRERSSAANAAMGSDVYIGRKLWRVLRCAGFADIEVEILVQHSGGKGIRPFAAQLDPNLALPLLNLGLITAEEMQSLREEVAAFLSAEEPFFLRPLVMVCGQKPR
ncbi:methyltransferase domain-containing protein [Polyangium sp. y55x31]|uniref:methyltransferase domain-containing protein n=1 Tax=Polyangium sp. y55x31 TaxID=3042688 RepID=UPI00248252AC|nr:methyltransferase domain-containing protein [Polyangium sp. y55x31]MDI1480358.1 methyltransferase domain-containing protein [Polyangium sp. y55x31]